MKISEIVNEQDLKDIKKKGIYKITYNDSERIYIGSTSQSFYIRWIQHMWEFRNGIHSNPKMMNVANKYGLKSLNFEIVEVVNDVKNVLFREQYYIDLFNSYNKGLNCSPSAYSTTGCERNEETLVKYFYHKVSQYSQDGTFIKTYKSMKEASKLTNTDYVTLSNACNGKTRLANKFQWKKGDNEANIGAVKTKSESTVYQYNVDGKYIQEWGSLKAIKEFYGRMNSTLTVAIQKGREFENNFWSKLKIEQLVIKNSERGRKEIDPTCYEYL